MTRAERLDSEPRQGKPNRRRRSKMDRRAKRGTYMDRSLIPGEPPDPPDPDSDETDEEREDGTYITR